MHSALTAINERFPHVRDQAAHLFEHDDDFRGLCAEYQACTEAVARLESPGGASAVLKEYAALRLRLESELLRYLEEHPPG